MVCFYINCLFVFKLLINSFNRLSIVALRVVKVKTIKTVETPGGKPPRLTFSAVKGRKL